MPARLGRRPLRILLAGLMLCVLTEASRPDLGQDFMESDSFMVTGVQAFSGGGDGWTPFSQPGPCLSISRYANIPLDLSPRATGCNAIIGQCRINLIVTAPNDCPALPKPHPVMLHFNGYHVAPRYYSSIANRLASWGNVVIMYDRPGRTVPSSEVETTFVGQILNWAATANSTGGHPLFASLDLSNLGVSGHSMGGSLAAVAAAERADLVKSVILLDPVDYTHLSTRVARAFIQSYGKAIAVLTAGVQCLDRNGCLPPLDHRPTREDYLQFPTCRNVDLFCCSWDDGVKGMENKTTAQLTQPTDGPDGYWEFAGKGSMLLQLKRAGHMNFMDWDPSTDDGFNLINCPQIEGPDKILPDALTAIAGWAVHKLRGGAISSLLEWAASPTNSDRLALSVKL